MLLPGSCWPPYPVRLSAAGLGAVHASSARTQTRCKLSVLLCFHLQMYSISRERLGYTKKQMKQELGVSAADIKYKPSGFGNVGHGNHDGGQAKCMVITIPNLDTIDLSSLAGVESLAMLLLERVGRRLVLAPSAALSA